MNTLGYHVFQQKARNIINVKFKRDQSPFRAALPPTLEVERDVGVALSERVAGVAAVVSAVLLGRRGHGQAEQVRVLGRLFAGYPQPGGGGDRLRAVVPGDVRHRVRLHHTRHDQVVPVLTDRWLLREPGSVTRRRRAENMATLVLILEQYRVCYMLQEFNKL